MFTTVFACVLQSSYNRERCIEILAKECQKYQSMLCKRSAVVSPVASHSTEEVWQHNYDSAESLSSMSSGHSVGAPSFGQMSQDVAHSLLRSSQSYPHIPSTESSGPVHDPTPRSSLPMSSLDAVPPGHQFRATGVNSPATAAVMQHGLFSFRPDPLNHDPRLSQTAGILATESLRHHPHGVLRQHGMVEGDQNLSSHNFPRGSPPAVKIAMPRTVTSAVSYRVNTLDSTGEQSKLTYLTATHVNMLSPEAGVGKLGTARHERSQNRFSDPPAIPSNRSSNAYSAAVYINPQQSYLSSPQAPTTYVSSLSSSCDSLYPSVTGGSETAVYQPCVPASSPSTVLPASNTEYAKGMKYVNSVLQQSFMMLLS